MPIGDLLAQITGEPSPTQATIPIPPKRKASESEPLRRPADKLQRTSSGSLATANSSQPINPSSRPSGVDTSMSKMKLEPNGRTLTPTASSTFKNGQPTPPPTDGGPSKAPKKGSFAEIMARGKAVQATRGQVGKIQHKRIEKLPSKREREEMKMQKGAQLQKNIGPNGKFRNGTPTGANGRPQAGNGTKGAKPTEPEKKVKKAALATTGYAGTARPKPGASKAGASRSGPSSRPMQSSKRYTYASEEEDEEEIDEQEDYASDVSSDMEAAAFEVDEEEEFAARVARKEDAEALAEENRLKREKEAKKRRLMAMAAKRR